MHLFRQQEAEEVSGVGGVVSGCRGVKGTKINSTGQKWIVKKSLRHDPQNIYKHILNLGCMHVFFGSLRRRKTNMPFSVHLNSLSAVQCDFFPVGV